MSERCNISPRFSMKFFGRCNISRTFGFYNTLIKYGGDTTMTWPFENDTSAIVKKLAKRNVSSNRIFCFFNVLTIALAISLIVGISLFQQGSKISEQKILNQMQQATIGGLTAEQIEVLKKEPDLEDIVPYKHF